MKPLWAAFGIILLMSGLIIAFMAGLGHEVPSALEWDSDTSPVEVYNSRNITRFLNEGDWFKLEIYAPQDWSDNMEPPTPEYAKPFKPAFVNITDPFGSQTELLAIFLKLSEDPQKALVFYNVSGTGEHETIEAHGIENILFEIPLGSTRPGIVAKAMSSGNYTADVWFVVGGGSDPYGMVLTKGALTEASTVEYSVMGFPLSYAGAVVFVVGVVLVAFGFGTSRKERSRRRLR